MKINKLHHWFVSNRKNKFHPIALRSSGLIVFLAIFIAIPFVYNITTAKQFRVLGYATNVTVSDIYSLSNQERTNVGLTPLILNSQLNSAALAKANDMMADNYWAHIAPDGTTPWYFIESSGYDYITAGENLAKDFNTSSGVVAGWMASTSHRENILNSSYKDVGYAVVNGVLQGSETTLIVAMYGSKNDVVIAAAPIQTESTASTQTTAATATTPTQTTTTATATTSEITEATSATPTTTAEIAKSTNTSNETITPQTETQTTKTTETDTATIKENAGLVEGVMTSAPVKAYNSFNWGQKVSILLTFTMILLFIMKHTLIWREQKRGARHIWLRSHPLGQAAILTVVLTLTIISGAGIVL